MSKTPIETTYPGIPTDEVLDVAWIKKHVPDGAAWLKAHPHLLEKTNKAAEEAKAAPADSKPDAQAPTKGKE